MQIVLNNHQNTEFYYHITQYIIIIMPRFSKLSSIFPNRTVLSHPNGVCIGYVQSEEHAPKGNLKASILGFRETPD